jgi:hypothetical protein
MASAERSRPLSKNCVPVSVKDGGGTKQKRRCLKVDSTIGRAEALRRAILPHQHDASDPRSAYPAYSAPFELVGEGS